LQPTAGRLLNALRRGGDRWQLPRASFRKFLVDNVPIDRGMMRCRDVLIHIAMLPVTLAIAGTLIGLAWSVAHAG
jgi:hypothetical protein